MAAVWPTSTSEYAAPMNEIPKVVFSKTLENANWPESRIPRGDLAEEIAALKREPGNDLIAHGGATFARALSRERLIDEYRLVIQPAALGAGLALLMACAPRFISSSSRRIRTRPAPRSTFTGRVQLQPRRRIDVNRLVRFRVR
jgi:dihydrofolate reductase